jgi:hypothetical protein
MKYFLIFVWIVAALWPAANANAENLRVRLLAEVTVQQETLRLSDLLPDGAGAPLKGAAERLSLGRAPQVGSVRVFTASELRNAIRERSPGMREVDIPEQVVVRRQGWPLETETVRRTLGHSNLLHHVDLSQARITLPAGFTTAATPQFEVTGLQRNPDQFRLFARMRCRKREFCGSFLAEIVLSAAQARIRLGEHERGSGKIAELSPPSVVGPVLVQPGRVALLVIEGDGFRITEPVMPLTQARLGESVRVSDSVTHRSLMVEVSGRGLLRTLGAMGRGEAR